MGLRRLISRLLQLPEPAATGSGDAGALLGVDARPTLVRGPEPLPGHYDDRPKSHEIVEALEHLERRSIECSDSLLDPANEVTVTLTTHGDRAERAFLAIEAIGSGSVLPARLVLALGESDAAKPLPDALQRLQSRGLEVLVVPDRMRVHSKYWGVVSERAKHDTPLIVADDDQIYPKDWLEQLLASAAMNPGRVVAHRAHQIAIGNDGQLAPYLKWAAFEGTEPSFAAFGTGVSGMLLPATLLNHLREQGEKFLEVSPTADDVWLHSQAVAANVRTVQVSEYSANYDFVPGTQHVGLYLENVHGNANDAQISASHTPETLARIAGDPWVGSV